MPPLVIEGPEDEIVGVNGTTGKLSTSATFTCTGNNNIIIIVLMMSRSIEHYNSFLVVSHDYAAVGLPAPVITWTYNASLTGEILTYSDSDPNVRTIAMGKDQNGLYNGRFRVTSTLVLPISPTDGGTVTCKTGPSDDQFDNARLTVLSKFTLSSMHCSC